MIIPLQHYGKVYILYNIDHSVEGRMAIHFVIFSYSSSFNKIMNLGID